MISFLLKNYLPGMDYSLGRQTERVRLVASYFTPFSFSSGQSSDELKFGRRPIKVRLWCMHKLPSHWLFSAHLWTCEVSKPLQPNCWRCWNKANCVHAEHHWLIDHKGTIYSTALLPHSGEITANVLLISLSDDITTADLIVSLASLSSLSITPDFKRKNKTKSNEWNEPWD